MRNIEHGHIYLYGFAKGRDLSLTEKAITLCREWHKGQFRDDGLEYSTHPIRATNGLITRGVVNDIVLALELLHDAIEDGRTTKEELEKQFNKLLADYVDAIAKKPGMTTDEYYSILRSDIILILAKAADREHNVSDMIDSFTLDRLEKYIVETEDYVLPMIKEARGLHPEYGDALVSFRDSIENIIRVVKKYIIVARELEKVMQENIDLKAGLVANAAC